MQRARPLRLALAVLTFVVAAAVGIAAAGGALAATGPDVSNYQHPNGAPIDWAKVKGAGHSFVFVKATEGPSGAGGYYTNPYFASDWAGARAAGLLRGAYHFGRPQLPFSSAVEQARYFVSVTGTMRNVGDLPPVLDLETTGGLSPNDLVVWTGLFLGEVERLTGRTPVIYSGYYFWRDQVANTTLYKDHRFWIARYTNAPDPYPLPDAWSTWTFWQYTSSAFVPGIVGNVDMNRFCCADANLVALADGSTANPAAGNPFGNVDDAHRVPGGIDVRGWAIDPDTTAPVTVHAWVDGSPVVALAADGTRPDLVGPFPGWGAKHGFDGFVPTGPGDHTVCLYAINTGSGSGNTPLGCRSVVGTPVGGIDLAGASAPGTLRIAGWAIDPDVDDPIDVHVYVDGRGAAIARADRPAPAVTEQYPAATPDHGFDVTVGALSTGAHQVCAYAINVGSGAGNATLGCRTVSVLPASPIGAIDTVAGGAGGVYVRGWALDPDTTGPIDVHVWVDNAPLAALRADQTRPDLAAPFPVYGPAHGYAGLLGPLAPGPHTVCVYGIDVGPGDNAGFGCRSITVPTGPPFGALDGVSVRLGAVTARGWAIDPDTAAPVTVQLFVDGTAVGQGTTGVARADVGAAFPAWPADRGYEVVGGPIGGGSHQVCARGVDPVSGATASLGCRTVNAPGGPFGSLDTAERTTPSSVHLRGWAIDPDTTAPITVHVYVDGAGVAILTADQDRPDLGADFAWFGTGHGWSTTIGGLSDGPHTVCAYAINTASGAGNTTLDCVEV